MPANPDPMWTGDATMTVVTFLSGSNLERALAVFKKNSADPEPALRRWIGLETEIAADSPILSRLLLINSLNNIQWDVVVNYIRIKSEVLQDRTYN
jgi:hypothetical protein